MSWLHVCVKGRVQGVGFRYAVYREAETLGLTGWVRNRYDGCVEAEFQGTRSALEAMLDWCREGPAFARVTDVEAEWHDSGADHADFRIR